MDLIIWGAKGHANVVLDALRSHGPVVLAFGDNDEAIESPLPEVPLVHNYKDLAQLIEPWINVQGVTNLGFVVAIGGTRGRDRHAIAQTLESMQLRSIDVFHPSAQVSSSAQIGRGIQLCANTSIGPNSILGESVIVNTGGIVEHDCQLGDGVHVAPGATLLGEVVVKNFAFIGANATVLPRIRIGEGAIIGAGAVVTRDVPPNSTVRGNPAR